MMSPVNNTPIKTPIKKSDEFKVNKFCNRFSVLPSHITPPSGLTKFIARNPFEADLTNKLHVSVISPSVFSKIASPSVKGSPGFTWSVDELALMHPAKIDEFSIQQMHCSDPEIEKNAQEAINRFFNENEIIPSPFDCKPKQITADRERDIPAFSDSSFLKKEAKDCWTQTTLSLPPNLPPDVEKVLKPYFTFTQDQNSDNEEVSSSSNNSSLRRKLFCDNDDEDDDDSENEFSNSICISPVQSNVSVIHNLSPPQTGMFFHGTPLRYCKNSTLLKSSSSQIIQRTFGSPLAHNGDSPCDVSPISNPVVNMSCQSIKSPNRSVMKLDFTKDMSIETSIMEENDIHKTTISYVNETNENNLKNKVQVSKMMTFLESSDKFTYEEKENFMLKGVCGIEKQKFLESCKNNFSDSYALHQSNMLSGNYLHQFSYNSAHDTGYQTYASSSNLTNNIENYSISSKQRMNWDERMVPVDEELPLSEWRENMISSTPSRRNEMNEKA